MKRRRLTFQPAPVSFWQELLGGAADWPRFVQDLRGASGIYVIRERDSGRVLYVGESHTGRLKKTLLRHFQTWSGKTAGPTYARNAVEIAVEALPAAAAVNRQNYLIDTLRPRDNRIIPGRPKPPQDENPF